PTVAPRCAGGPAVWWSAMPVTRLRPYLGEIPAGRVSFAHGEGTAPHSHRQGQLVYAAAGVFVTPAPGRSWVVPVNPIARTPPGVEHHHRAYGESEIRLLRIPPGLCASLPSVPTVLVVTPLLREALLALTDERQLQPGRRIRLRNVVVDELRDIAEQNLICT